MDNQDLRKPFSFSAHVIGTAITLTLLALPLGACQSLEPSSITDDLEQSELDINPADLDDSSGLCLPYAEMCSYIESALEAVGTEANSDRLATCNANLTSYCHCDAITDGSELCSDYTVMCDEMRPACDVATDWQAEVCSYFLTTCDDSLQQFCGTTPDDKGDGEGDDEENSEDPPTATGATWLKPYASDSIWKRPIAPSLARTAAPGLKNHHDKASNREKVIFLDASAGETVEVTVYQPKSWRDRCGSGKLQGKIRLPKDWRNYITNPHQFPDGKWSTPNNQMVVRQNATQTRVVRAGAKCGTGVAAGWLAGPFDFTGDGVLGGRGASHLGHGGELRAPDFTGDITHALSLLPNPEYLYGTKHGGVGHKGYRWPASHADGGYNNPSSSGYYEGTTPSLTMGSLLALPKNFDLSTINDPFVRKLAKALKQYGGYITDISAWDCTYIGTDIAVVDKFAARWTSAAKTEFLEKVQRKLEVVEQNN